MRDRYGEAENEALALLATGDTPRDAKLNPVELASWTQVAVIALASDVALLLY